MREQQRLLAASLLISAVVHGPAGRRLHLFQSRIACHRRMTVGLAFMSVLEQSLCLPVLLLRRDRVHRAPAGKDAAAPPNHDIGKTTLIMCSDLHERPHSYTFFAKSNPIVLISIADASSVVAVKHLPRWHIHAVEGASIPSFKYSTVVRRDYICFALWPL
jgi:hypothetical protein